MRVFHQIGTPIGVVSNNESNSKVTLGATAKASGSVFVAKAEAGINASGEMGTKEATTKTSAVDHLQLLIVEMSGSDFVLFIDDFHYMGAEVQEEVAREIKEAIDKGVKIVCASVPHHSEDVLRANSDLRGRIASLNFDYWPVESLKQIARQGFNVLNVDLPGKVLDKMVEEVAGSPQLMQSLCLNTALELGVRGTAASATAVPDSQEFYSNVCARTVVGADYSGTVEKLEEGPKTRGTDRIQYRLKDGKVGDVYTIVLQSIAIDPPKLHIRYAELTDRVKAICEDEVPSGSSLIGACGHISQLANDGAARPIIEWDTAEDVFDIRDPYLLFFIRWCKPRHC